MQESFKIGEISRLYGIGADSLRYYEKLGILSPQRGENGYRYYRVEDIWKLNIIRDLRGLGFGMEQIRQYLLCHTVDSTLALLEREQTAITEKIHQLELLQRNVRRRRETILAARDQVLDTVTLRSYPPRPCHCIREGYSQEYEMDVLIKRLINMDRERLYVIGNNQVGTVISLAKAREQICYQSVFVIDETGTDVLPGGVYLSVSYQGSYRKSQSYARRLLDYAEQHGIALRGDLLEILRIDIHTSQDVSEHITELQVLTDRQA